MTSTKYSSEANAASHHHIRDTSEGQGESRDSRGSADWKETEKETFAMLMTLLTLLTLDMYLCAQYILHEEALIHTVSKTTKQVL